jgi:hypothetical protein
MFILSGPIELFLKVIALFIKHSIGSWILIRAMRYASLLDYENPLLPRHGVD